MQKKNIQKYKYTASLKSIIIVLLIGIVFSNMAINDINNFQTIKMEKISIEYLKHVFFYIVAFSMLFLPLIIILQKLIFSKKHIVVSEEGILCPGSIFSPSEKFIRYPLIIKTYTSATHRTTYFVIETYGQDYTFLNTLFESNEKYHSFVYNVSKYRRKQKYNKNEDAQSFTASGK